MRRTEVRRLVRDVAASYGKHRISQHAAAVAFRIVVGFVPLVLLGLGLLSAFGLEDVWTDTLAPAVKDRVTQPVFRGIDYSVERIFSSSSAGLIVFASVLLLWQLSRAIRSITIALDEIHDVDDTRSHWRVLATTLALAVVTGLFLVASIVDVTVLPRLGTGLVRVVLTVAAWMIAVVLLGLVVALVVRYAPAEHPSPAWASAGSAVVVAFWVGASLAFGWWAGSLANYKSAVGSLTVFLVFTAYAFTSAAIFLIGVEIDERARKQTSRGG